jgi:hypothetical protein
MASHRLLRGLFLLLLCSAFFSFQTPILEQVYTSQLGVQEAPKGSNWGPEVKKYLAHVQTRSPAPWCAAFVRFCLDSAGIKSSITAYSPTAQNAKNLVWYRDKWIKAAQPGDVFTIFFPSMGRIAHTGFYHRTINPSICETVEGNTNTDGSREGYMVCKRKRSFHSLYSLSRW